MITVGGIVLGVIASLVILGFAVFTCLAVDEWKPNVLIIILALITIAGVWLLVYDMDDDVIEEFQGKFDVEYMDERIPFDDENGCRHIIYFNSGTVVINEIQNTELGGDTGGDKCEE